MSKPTKNANNSSVNNGSTYSNSVRVIVLQEVFYSLLIMKAQHEEAANWDQEDDEEQIDERSVQRLMLHVKLRLNRRDSYPLK